MFQFIKESKNFQFTIFQLASSRKLLKSRDLSFASLVIITNNLINKLTEINVYFYILYIYCAYDETKYILNNTFHFLPVNFPILWSWLPTDTVVTSGPSCDHQSSLGFVRYTPGNHAAWMSEDCRKISKIWKTGDFNGGFSFVDWKCTYLRDKQKVQDPDM